MLFDGIASIFVTMGIGFNSLFPAQPAIVVPTPKLDKPILVNAENVVPSPIQDQIQPDSKSIESPILEHDTSQAEPLQTALVLAATKDDQPKEATKTATVAPFVGPVKPTATPKSSPKAVVQKVPAEKTLPKASPDANLVKSASETPKPTTEPVSTSSTPKPNSQNFQIIWDLVNNHRASIGLPAFEKDERLCRIAEARAPQLHNEVFGSGSIHQGLRDMNLPYWNTENVAAYGSEQANFNWLMGDAIHRKAIESHNKYSCGTCLGNACVQEFSSFIPK